MEEHTRSPEPNADLEQILRFALTYNGYRRLARDPNLLHGVIRPVLDAVDSGRGVPEWAGLDLLRGTLFHLQRSTHHVGYVSPDEERQMRALAAAIGRLARNSPLVADEVVAFDDGGAALGAEISWPPWPELQSECAEPYFGELMRFVDDERRKRRGGVYPTEDAVFAAFQLTPFAGVRVVILGQDPYPNPGQATGLAFSVPRDLRNLPTSLVNIHKAMRHDGLIPPEHGDLTAWAEQGVLLLNTALTVPQGGKPNHSARWRPFTKAVIRLLSEREHPVVFVLWGVEARTWKSHITNPDWRVIEAPHPASRGPWQVQFRESRTFSRVNKWLADLGDSEITWSIT
jgi:uracil-DNA glycosylase